MSERASTAGTGGMTQPGDVRQAGELQKDCEGGRGGGPVQDKAEARGGGQGGWCARSCRPAGRAAREEGAAGSMLAGQSCKVTGQVGLAAPPELSQQPCAELAATGICLCPSEGRLRASTHVFT